jgi:hypothetical protein
MHFDHIAHVLKLNNTTYLASPHLFSKMGEELCPSQAMFSKNAPNLKLLANVFKTSFPVDIIPNLSHSSQT